MEAILQGFKNHANLSYQAKHLALPVLSAGLGATPTIMRVDSLTSTSSNLYLKAPRVGAGASGPEAAGLKSLGETPPTLLSLKEIGEMASLFAPAGLVGRLKKRLNYLKKKKCQIVPAKGTIACADDEDVVYLGIDFLKWCMENNQEETLAGVLAHEWGHTCALKPRKGELQKMNWNQIFELRRAHETLADEISGRLLFLMGYTPEGIVRFLTRKKKDTHNLKYHKPEMRAQVIRYGFEAEKRKGQLAKSLFSGTSYKNDYQSILLDIA